ncbi:hypothetical protein Y032_0156g3103 [Ancylostoma ceylanicum]|uniref:Uncharacterized protein n=1 Tax=Ancylostoma ceylanicum TaxID=53326 RepID=A0A016SZ91_9BILA|nr:hypothetical protein Y032_0156g3103 [Ancylostoma ceylanicum]
MRKSSADESIWLLPAIPHKLPRFSKVIFFTPVKRALFYARGTKKSMRGTNRSIDTLRSYYVEPLGNPYRLGPFDRYCGGLAYQHPPDQYGIDSADPSGYQSLSSFSVNRWRSLRMQTTVTDPILFWAIRLDTSHSILLFPLPVAFLLDTSHLLYLFFCVAIPSDSSHNP